MQHARDTGMSSLQPEALLKEARSHEEWERNRYRQMALRFLPYSAATHRLMDMLAQECEQLAQELTRAGERLRLDLPPTEVPSGEHGLGDSHFFILDDGMALRVLSRALADERRSLAFYRWLADANGTPQLDRQLATCVERKRADARVLEEALDHWLAAP